MQKKIKRKPKAVVLDYDDTIGNFLGALCQLHNRIHDTHISEYDFKSWNFIDMQVKDGRGNVVKGSDLMQTFRQYEAEIYASMKPLHEAKFALETIKAIGYKIIILTARPQVFEHQTFFNLVINDLPYDEVIHNEAKAKIIKGLSKTNNIQLFVDDNAKTVVDVFENCKVNTVCLIEKKHNSDLDLDEDIVRVGGLIDCVRHLKRVNK